MKDRKRYWKLCEPFQIGQLRLRNRIVKAPFCTVMADREGFVTDSLISCYETIAKGGVGISIIEGTVVDPMGISGCPRLAVYDDKYIHGLSRLVTAIHKYNCPAVLQLQHAGPAYSAGVYKGQQIVSQDNISPTAASTLTISEMPMSERNPPRGLTIHEIKKIEIKFIQAAGRARMAGFDGVELHAAHHYLLNSFLSRAWNRREDEYGGKIENRVRLVINIIRGIKQRMGSNFLVGVRINGIEYGSPKGLTVEETQEISLHLQNAGADYLSISGWGFGAYKNLCNMPEQILYPGPPEIDSNILSKLKKPGIFVEMAEKIKSKVDVPVMTVGRLNPKLGERILKKGKADLIAFARSLIADPELPNKIASGNMEDIAPCTACLTCWDSLEKGEHLRCRINPLIGKGKVFISMATKKKQVMIVGGGPAGMESARVAAMRGHQVTLYDRGNKLGGLLHMAALIKGHEIEDLMPLVRYFKRQLVKTGVRIKLGTEVNQELLKEIKPEVLILATGAKLKESVNYRSRTLNVLSSSDLHHMVKLPLRVFGVKILEHLSKIWLPLGGKVLVIGGLMQGYEIAQFLVKRKRKVTIVELSDQLGTGLPNINRIRLLEWMFRKGVVIHGGNKYKELDSNGLEMFIKDNSIEADTVLAVSIPEKNDLLNDINLDGTREFYQIGDCKMPGLIADAIEVGFSVGMTI